MGPRTNKLNAPFGPIPIEYPIAKREIFIFLKRFYELDGYFCGVGGVDEQVRMFVVRNILLFRA